MKVSIDLTPHPENNDVRRKATHTGFSMSESSSMAVIMVIISHYDADNNHLFNTIPDKKCQISIKKNKVKEGQSNDWEILENVAQSNDTGIYKVIKDTMQQKANAGFFDHIY